MREIHTIEDIILQDLGHETRGIAVLRDYLPPNYCEQAARLVLNQSGTVFIATGFYISYAGMPETDGPPGALAIGSALTNLGFRVYYITDIFTAPLMNFLAGKMGNVIVFPIDDDNANSRARALTLLSQFQPNLLISVERCGLTSDGTYLNMRDEDISKYNAPIDYLFHYHQRTIGIGDGGNEIGMGNLAEVIPAFPKLPKNPCVTKVTLPLIATVSNWGGYGLVAGLSLLVRRDLLFSLDQEQELIKHTVALGAVDSFKGTQTPGVDGFSLEENSRILEQLHILLEKDGCTYSSTSV